MKYTNFKKLEDLLVDVPNFPKKGVIFKDISLLIKTNFNETIDALALEIGGDKLNQTDYFAGIDARGFIVASALAYKLNKGLVMIRKAGKLPLSGGKVSYQLEYGTAEIEIQQGEGKMIIIDDLVATGGTLTAGCKLAEQVGYNIIGIACLINLAFLNNFKFNNLEINSLFCYKNNTYS